MIDVCITVDLEPDCPPFLEGWSGAEEGMPRLLDLLASRGVASTVFTTGETAERFPELVRRIPSEGHELACHGQTHRGFSTLSESEADWEIAHSAQHLRAYAPVTSFRAPYLDLPDRYLPLLERHGFELDSSRARYKPGHWFTAEAPTNLRRVPASMTSSALRLPPAVRNPLLAALRSPVVLFVHPWEFVDLTDTGIRWDCRLGTGDPALESMAEVLDFFSGRGARFLKMGELTAPGRRESDA